VYRDAWPVEGALALLCDEADTAFDGRCFDALVRVLERYEAEPEPASPSTGAPLARTG
jgi:HD-GYP domain-containing protein (c-di-GMP phosphodiesterase class II)